MLIHWVIRVHVILLVLYIQDVTLVQFCHQPINVYGTVDEIHLPHEINRFPPSCDRPVYVQPNVYIYVSHEPTLYRT